MKSQINISLDTEVVIEARAHIKNISATINGFLREYLQFQRDNPGDMEEDLMNKIIQQKATIAAMEQDLKRMRPKQKKTVHIPGREI